MAVDKTAIVIFGNQLFRDHAALKKYPHAPVIMIEADNIFRKHFYHKHKIMLILLAMRRYRKFLINKNRHVEYVEYKKASEFLVELQAVVKKHSFSKLIWMRASDKKPNAALLHFCSKHGFEFEMLPNQQFLTEYEDLKDYFGNNQSLLMDKFYRWQRQRLSILLEKDKPTGGKWSYDYLNRKPLPKDVDTPKLPAITRDQMLRQVAKLVDDNFKSNPGETKDFWLPTSHGEADKWFKDFVAKRLADFGLYEDAMRTGEPVLFHSVISPLLNTGLLSPAVIIEKVLEEYAKGKISLNTCEGFVRQIIGWREYMYGVYEFRQAQVQQNFFGFKKKLEAYWYQAPDHSMPMPLYPVLATTFKYGYNHHIERLMVLGNWFLLNEYDPAEVYEWFSSMYVDAYEWVMVPNVFGMSQYADGGKVATKPYISGGNYLQKMGGWWPSLKAAQDSEFTDLYWKFIKKHAAKFGKNPRMSLIVSQAKKRAS